MNISVLDEDLGLFLMHHIDFTYRNEKRQELMMLIVLSLFALTGLMFLIYITFINKEVLEPLQKLQSALQSMLQKKYKPIQIENDDEIGKIFQASNKIFETFWDNYAHLESYKKSVDTANLVTKTDLSGRITYANALFCQTSEYTQQEVLGQSHSIVRHPEMTKGVFKDLWSTIKKGNIWRGVIKNKTKSGGFYWVDAVISPTYDANNYAEGYISIRRDITELMTSKEELEFRANYDLLTGLKSRNKLHGNLSKTTAPCLVLINIDRFSQINDFYGHSFGDKLLQKFTQILQEALKKECVHRFNLYRNGGDEFAILLEEFTQEMVVANITKILSHIEKTPLALEEKELNLNLSCGVSFEASHAALLSADMALKLSKIERKPLVVYSHKNSLNKHYENNLLWTGKLKKAIEEDRVVPFFQPIVNNETLVREKYEALVRIIETNEKVISPFFFLDIAKQTKQYLSLTKTMASKSFEIFREKEMELSINLTIEDITNDEIKTFLFAKLDEHQNVAHRLVLEIVESESIKDYDAVIDFITIAKAKGCKIAIDDFGSGYSNFEYLIKLQADYIKIDGSLIKNIVAQKESKVVVSTIVSFAKQMGIKTIAEFVENEEIFNAVKELGVDYSQGYHFQAPQRNIGE
jgi:diguanylate cyclase (GGDEF)-like protein/PAS domain S-box-containing protein